MITSYRTLIVIAAALGLLVAGRTIGTGLLAAGTDPAEVCATVTHLDGLVLARSAFHHSMNYRSVVVRGTARRVEDRGSP